MLDDKIIKQIQLYKKIEKDKFFLDELANAEANQDETDLQERFYTDLEFGTGGIRGIIGAGTNRLNPLVVQQVTEGWAQFLIEEYSALQPKVIIAYDSRNFSDVFARIVSEVLTAHNIKVYCFTAPRPTPQLSYSIRALQAQSGLVITASHNPPKYNGLKIYGDDGAQVIAPQDKAIMDKIAQVKSMTEFPYLSLEEARVKGLYQALDSDMDILFQDYVASVLIQPEIFDVEDDFKVVYTPLHGTGAFHLEQLMNSYNIQGIIEPSQHKPDGNFPTVTFPNPEDPAALKNAIVTAKQIGAQLVVATDPDADRVGLAEKLNDEFICLTGNQIGALLLDYILQIKKETNTLEPNSVFINTIVTSCLQEKIATAYGVKTFKTYTGFKNIAERMTFLEIQQLPFVFSCEESYGYLASMDVRDKDGISISMLSIEMAKYYYSQNKTLSDRLEEIYVDYGYHKEITVNKTLEGASGKVRIAQIMQQLRNDSPKTIGSEKVTKIEDYQLLSKKDGAGNTLGTLDFSSVSNVIIYTTESGNVLCVRPSGTEPKIKFYFLFQTTPELTSNIENAKVAVQLLLTEAEKTLDRWFA